MEKEFEGLIWTVGVCGCKLGYKDASLGNSYENFAQVIKKCDAHLKIDDDKLHDVCINESAKLEALKDTVYQKHCKKVFTPEEKQILGLLYSVGTIDTIPDEGREPGINFNVDFDQNRELQVKIEGKALSTRDAQELLAETQVKVDEIVENLKSENRVSQDFDIINQDISSSKFI